jgi:hypothetical protein
MKLSLLFACLVAGTTTSVAWAGDAAVVNPKTSPKVVATKGGKQYPAKNTQLGLTAPGAGQQAGGLAFTPSTLAIGNSDDCSTAKGLIGTGTFAYDSSAATTGAQGQAEPACLFFGSTTIDNDVWFTWTAPSSGVATWSNCGVTTHDSKVAVYAGSGCPTGAALACNDDACASLQTQVQWNVTAGSSYTIQVGSFPGAAGTAANFSLGVAAPAANDSCTTPVALTGAGPYSYDSTAATTGAEGQSEGACLFFASTTIDRDVWFTWTAPTSGNALLANCGTAHDSKIAVYAGAGCPTGAALGCNDDACGLQTQVVWPVVAGQTYTIQLGSFPGAAGASAAFTINVLPPVTNDDCTAPIALSGAGPFTFNQLGATTGAQGQTEASCLFFGSTTIDNDVWYTYTAPISGNGVIDFCGNTTDTKVAVYVGSGCPAPNTAIACNDDACGLQSQVTFCATAGTTYLIQVGTFPGVTGGTGTFLVNVVPPGAANDECGGAIALGATGPYSFDNSTATTSCVGQSNAICTFFGSPAMETDVWYTWTATSSGNATLTTCGFTSIDTKVAVYSGAGCPTGAALACNDDACPGFQSTVCWPVTAGQSYTIQVGVFPGAAGGIGSFDITVAAANPCVIDDGSTENLLGWTAGGEMVWMNSFGTVGGNTTITSVDVAWGSAAFPNFGPANGSAATVAIWADGPTQDGDPTDATLVSLIPTTVANVDTDSFNTIAIAPVTVNGIFFVGAGLIHTAGQFVAPMDEGCAPANRAWFFGDNTGAPVNYTNPGANTLPPASFTGLGFPAVVLVRPGCSSGPATFACDPGSGGVISCPCSNPASGSGRGCNNSFNTGGATITATGVASLAASTVQFITSSQTANGTTILLQGNNQIAAGVPFGQGVRCVGGTLKRLYVKSPGGTGGITAPSGADLDIPNRSANLGDVIAPASTRYYMAYYRDPIILGACSATSTFNSTPMGIVVWN